MRTLHRLLPIPAYFVSLIAGVACVACGSQPPAASPSVAAPPAATVTSAASATPSASAPAVTATPPAEPTAEEKKKAEESQQLAEDRSKWQKDHEAEVARWTPELHAAAKALADKSYPSGRAALQAAVASKHRKPGDAARDKYRHPVETLSFFGFKPTLTVLEVAPGEGWYTEILAPALAAKGKLLITTSDPNGPKDERSTFNAERLKAFLSDAPEVYGKVQPVIVDDKNPTLGDKDSVDLVIAMREVHGMVNNGTLDTWLGAVHDVLKPGGVLGIEDHRSKPGSDPVVAAKAGYVPEKWLIEKVEAAGFTLAGKSGINDNPKDTKDYPEGVWALPPTLRLGDKDRAKYLAIGESDRMTLKFVKKKDASAAKSAAAKSDPAAAKKSAN